MMHQASGSCGWSGATMRHTYIVVLVAVPVRILVPLVSADSVSPPARSQAYSQLPDLIWPPSSHLYPVVKGVQVDVVLAVQAVELAPP